MPTLRITRYRSAREMVNQDVKLVEPEPSSSEI